MKLQFLFLPIPEELMKSKVISWGAKYLFGIYAKANKEKVRYSAKYLAERMGCEKREVIRRKKELRENNLILTNPRKGRVDEVSINFELVSIIQGKTPDQTDRGENGQEGGVQSGQGGTGRSGHPNSTELFLNNTFKEDDLKNKKRYDEMKTILKNKLSVSYNDRTEVDEEVAMLQRAGLLKRPNKEEIRALKLEKENWKNANS